MKVQKKLSSKVIVEANGSTLIEVFTELSKLEEIFGIESRCGMCGCEDLRYVVRANKKKQKFFEVHCQAKNDKGYLCCKAKFAFGQHQEEAGSLFPQKKLKDGTYKPNNGWSIYKKEEEEGNEEG